MGGTKRQPEREREKKRESGNQRIWEGGNKAQCIWSAGKGLAPPPTPLAPALVFMWEGPNASEKKQ